MKSRDKPSRESHEKMMTKLKVSAKSHGPEAKVRMKTGMKKIKALKLSEQAERKHSKSDLAKAHKHMKEYGG